MAMATDAWGKDAKTYEGLVAERTRVAARDLVEMTNQVHPFDTPGASAFDDGCGTGALTEAIKTFCPEIPLLSADLSPGMVEYVKKLSKDHGWTHHSTDILNAHDLSAIDSESITHSMSSFMLMLIPTPHVAVGELYRITKPGGVLGIAYWRMSKGPFHPAWEVACRKLDPEYVTPYVMDPYWSDPDSIKEGLEKIGFKDVAMKIVDYPWPVANEQVFEKFIWDGGNPCIIGKLVEPFVESGGTREELQPHLLEALREQFGDGQGGIVGLLPVTHVTARK